MGAAYILFGNTHLTVSSDYQSLKEAGLIYLCSVGD